ncbi:OmpA family protein [Echinicola sp. 20G]|uniref:OmpA family protein n=1 Tax=Echinicola sp. 20G TaxID=2781961 RepID=UPI001910771A|nr:OmpA family protein [Echinicola sp. 20G]
MKKRNTYYLFLALTMGIASCSSLKNKDLVTANQQYDMLNYAVAAEHYNVAWEHNELPEIARGLANSYLEMRDFELAESWYAKLDRSNELENEDRVNFAKVLIANSKFGEAREQLIKYSRSEEQTLTKEEIDNLLYTARNAKDLLNDPKDIQVRSLTDINTPFADFGGEIIGDRLTFTSDRMEEDPKKMHVDQYNALRSDFYGWTGNGYLQVYEAKGDWDNFKVDSVYALEGFSSAHHSGPVFESEEFVFWVRSGKPSKEIKGENVNKKNYTLYPQVFYKVKLDSSWSELKDFSFNNPYEYSVSDPFWDSDRKRLYFSSNKPDGLGKADIYYSKYLGDDKWSEPINLGDKINSSGDERTPYISKEGELYFSSNGKGGLGGLDVFKSEPKGNDWAKPENQGAPINSTRDDFAFFINYDIPDRGVFSSDRSGGKGLDDIYAFILDINSKIFLKGLVKDKITMEPLPNAVVELVDKSTGSSFTYVTNEEGEYDFILNEETVYDVEGRKTDYIAAELKDLSTKGIRLFADTTIVKDLYLDKIEIGKTIELENIYYDFDKWDIREDAALELDKLVKILEDNPTMKIDLNSHTDSRGSDEYNQILSEKRAQSAVDYIISRGVSRVRIEAKGYGESRLLNECDDGVECSDEQHQVNRRTEFTIVDY